MPTRYGARVTNKGQLTVPRQVRRLLGIRAGDDVAFEVGPNGIVVVPVRSEDPFRQYEGAWWPDGGMSTEEIDQWLRSIRGHDETSK
ncbi:MAG: AbrB/MazE/SpoVT family DNA-binding domain-containing protein [Chloroflexota bacterium]